MHAVPDKIKDIIGKTDHKKYRQKSAWEFPFPGDFTVEKIEHKQKKYKYTTINVWPVIFSRIWFCHRWMSPQLCNDIKIPFHRIRKWNILGTARSKSNCLRNDQNRSRTARQNRINGKADPRTDSGLSIFKPCDQKPDYLKNAHHDRNIIITDNA